jgi:dolichyl-diphosphooligosaccharide--protein glycosyltransferase
MRADVALLLGVLPQLSLGVIGLLWVLMGYYAVHCNWVTSSAYSSPSIVLGARGHHGERIIFDDFREVCAGPS